MTISQSKAKNFIWNSSGFSLVEMIVVVAVVGILAGASLTMMGHIHYANVQTAVETLDSELDKLQVNSMSKADKPYVYVYEMSDGYYMRTSTVDCTSFDSSVMNADGVKLCGKSIEIFMVKEGAGDTLVSGNSFIKLVYLRSGSFSPDTNVDAIRIVGNISRTISLILETGKHIVE